MPKVHLLAIDQGTTSTRAILFDGQAKPLRNHAVSLRQIYPANGWVEHDPGEIWRATLECCRAVLKGVEVALRAGSFVATLASKLAIAGAVA